MTADVFDLELVMHRDAAAFLAAAGTWLEEQEAQNDRLLGLCHDARDADATPQLGLWVTASRGAARVGALAYVPGTDLRLATRTTERAAGALAHALHERGLVPGMISGHAPGPTTFARRWTDSPRVVLQTRIHALTRVVRPESPAPGALVLVQPNNTEPFLPWYRAFSEETMGHAPATEHARARLARDIERARVFVWRRPDRASVTLVALGEPTRRGARIALVYTPPGLRGRGYATAAVAALSQRCLDGGREHCTLHTDRNNAAAERIYRRLGYRRVGDAVTVSIELDQKQVS